MTRRSIILISCLMWSFQISAQGLKLFSSEVYDAAPYNHQVVMEFLERYFGKELTALKHTTLEHKMADDKVYLRKGTLSDLQQVTDSLPFSINLLDKYYEVSWTKMGAPFVTIVFPAQYDLLLGMQKDEAMIRLKEDILAAPYRIKELFIPKDLSQQDDSIWQYKTGHFELESLTDAIYYNKVCDDFKPVFDNRYPVYSAANLFHGLIDSIDYRMYVEQSVYGMKTINYSLTLQQWQNYCVRLGMKIYFAVEEQREDGLLALIIAQSRELGFNHLMSVVIPDKFVKDQNAVLKVRFSPYIPTHNVKDLYKQETGNHKKKIWQ